ncbi:OLC1v1023200C1 [Oldenlandia corymbosa var. corymbosa]|uniref:OLC1v1023200C1 n=1 Tax=Oldenlandia corymbosa var. corymbosa TaxID=529605 RepID=A0AAV1C0B1_OLDCO|nr:OLC1v1023200C1 [Oldenlandia corymbosa var. corymbosa]
MASDYSLGAMDQIKKRKLDENGLVMLPDQDAAGISVEDSRKILEPFTREQLLEIVQTALLRHVDVLESVRSIADRDPAQRKLFIRGLGWDTTTEKLRALFAQYGELEEAIVILDKVTGKSKGYGFVTFKHIDGALQALKQPSKQIDGRMTVTQLASARASGGPAGGVGNNPVDVSERKIYVANVPYDMPAERLLAHFTMYGEIEEGPLGFDKETGKSKGFALFVYKTAEAARSSLVDPVKNIDGHQLNCKLAIDGKKGKPGVGGPGGGNGGHNNGVGTGVQSGNPGQYPGYPGYPGSSFGSNQLNPGLGGSGGGVPGMSGIANQAPGSTMGGGGAGFGGPYGGGSHYGGPGSTGYGGLGGAPTGLGGLGSGVGGAGRGSFFGVPPSSGGLPAGEYQQNGPYNLPSSGYQSQHHQPGTSPAPRVPTGGMYQGVHPYY